MNWIEQLKTKIGRIILQRNLPKAKQQVHAIPHFSDLHEVGIIYNANSKENEEQINQIAHFLREQGKKVWMMGYVDSKTLPTNKKFHISSEYFWKEKLNFFNLPEPSKIGNFITHKFDLILNLYIESELPLQALSTYCQSGYSMGAQLPNGLSYNDSIIDIGSDKNIQNLAAQMVHYLKVINQK